MSRRWSDDTPERLAESLAREETPDEILALLDQFVKGEEPGRRLRRDPSREASRRRQSAPAAGGLSRRYWHRRTR